MLKSLLAEATILTLTGPAVVDPLDPWYAKRTLI